MTHDHDNHDDHEPERQKLFHSEMRETAKGLGDRMAEFRLYHPDEPESPLFQMMKGLTEDSDEIKWSLKDALKPFQLLDVELAAQLHADDSIEVIEQFNIKRKQAAQKLPAGYFPQVNMNPNLTSFSKIFMHELHYFRVIFSSAVDLETGVPNPEFVEHIRNQLGNPADFDPADIRVDTSRVISDVFFYKIRFWLWKEKGIDAGTRFIDAMLRAPDEERMLFLLFWFGINPTCARVRYLTERLFSEEFELFKTIEIKINILFGALIQMRLEDDLHRAQKNGQEKNSRLTGNVHEVKPTIH